MELKRIQNDASNLPSGSIPMLRLKTKRSAFNPLQFLPVATIGYRASVYRNCKSTVPQGSSIEFCASIAISLMIAVAFICRQQYCFASFHFGNILQSNCPMWSVTLSSRLCSTRKPVKWNSAQLRYPRSNLERNSQCFPVFLRHEGSSWPTCTNM